MIYWKFLWLAALTLLPFPAHAASFDCAKAAQPIEKLICGDPALSKADETMAAAYQSALTATLDPPALRDDQRDWQRNRPTTASDLQATYAKRIASLNETADKWHAMPRTFAATKLPGTCFITPEVETGQTCRVEESGKVDGDNTLSYQLQAFFDGDLRMNGAANVFAAANGALTPLITAYVGTAHFERPVILKATAGTLLFIPGHIEGTGNFNAEQLYLWRDGSWRDVDTVSWQSDLARRLKNGLYAAKGIYSDYSTMTSATSLWRKEDGNCCPTGGRAAIKLGLKDRRLTIEDLHVYLGKHEAEWQ